MLDIVKNILDVVKSLLGLSTELKSAERQNRADMAKLFDDISACLAGTSAEIRAGAVPHGRCGELLTYGQNLPALVEGAIGVQKARELGDQLISAYAVERLAYQLANVPDRETHLAALEEASGKFRALANLMRVGQPAS
jgi:hypothetical protein